MEASTNKSISNVKNKINHLQSEIQYFSGKIESVVHQKQQAKRTLDQKLPELENVKIGIETSEKEIEVQKEKMAKRKEDLWEEFKAKTGVKSIEEFEARGLARAKELERKKLKLQDQISEHKSNLLFLEQKDLNVNIKNMKTSLEKDKAEIEKYKTEEKTISEDLSKGIKKMDGIKKEL